MTVDDFFKKENVFLVVGATNNEEKYGSKVFLDLKSAGYNVIAINRHGGEVHGTPAYTSVTEFLDRVEKLFSPEKRKETHAKIVLVLVVPPSAALAVLLEAREHDIMKAWFQPGSESEKAISYCVETGIEEIHGQCIMIEKP